MQPFDSYFFVLNIEIPIEGVSSVTEVTMSNELDNNKRFTTKELVCNVSTSPQVRVLVGGVHVDAPAVVPRALPAPVVHVHGGRARLPRLPTRGATRPPLLSHRQTGNVLHYLTIMAL